VDRRTLLAALGCGVSALLPGCSALGGDAATPAPPPETPVDGDGETRVLFTDTPRSPEPTPTPTPSPTPTATSTPTPTATATAGSGEAVVDVGEWAGTRPEARVVRFERRDALRERDLRADHRDEAPLRPSDGETWVDVEVAVRNRSDEAVSLSPARWSLVDLRDDRRAPDGRAMEAATGTLREASLGPFDGREARLVFSTPYPNELAFLRDDGATVRWVAG
jgi:hypothetical protein